MARLGLDIQSRIAAYVAGRGSLPELESWLSRLVAQQHEWTDPAADRLAMRLLNLLSQFHAAQWTENELRDECRPLLRTYSTDLVGPVAFMVTTQPQSVTEARVLRLQEAA